MLERLKHNFRLLLGAFDSVVYPLCDVRARLETPEVEHLYARGDLNAALCATHLGSYFGCTDDRSTRARVTRRIIETIIVGRPTCQVCEYLSRVEERLARAIRRLDSRMRFRKALEMAPLFCQRHVNLVASDPLALNFVQAAKLQRLRNNLDQVEIFNRESIQLLTQSTIAYPGAPAPEQPVLQLQESADTPAAEASEFEEWDDELQLRHVGKLESEAASLRYRNATLSEENGRLKAAGVASEATRRDLERDLAQLLAAAGERDSNPLKTPNQQP